MSDGKKLKPLTYGQLSDLADQQADEISSLKKLLREFQDRIKRIITNFPLGLIVVNKDNRIEALNQRAREIFQYSSEELAKQPITEIFPELSSIDAISEPRRVMGKRKSSEMFAAEVIVNELEMYGQDRLFVNVQDVTERHKLEQLRQDLIGMVSHDLRGPLTAIRVVLDMFEGGIYGDQTDRGMRAIKNAQTSADYLMSMVKNLLDSEKTESGTIEIQLHETSVGAIIEKAVITAEGANERESVGIEKEFTNDVLEADPDRIVQVLLNLISNAIKYSPDDSVVRVVAGMEGLNAKFQVIDCGPGIPEKMQPLIFERYRQLEQSEGTRNKGFGLGLAICKALIEKHNGKIWVESQEGKGSNFCFTIPQSHR